MPGNSFEHIKKINELMGEYTKSLNRYEMLQADFKDESDEVVKAALRVLLVTHLKLARSRWMDVQTEIHKHLTSFE